MSIIVKMKNTNNKFKKNQNKDFINGERYHIFNRGLDGHNIFNCGYDMDRFHQSLQEFNSIKSIGSIYENYFAKKFGHDKSKSGKLVRIIAYCMNPNHYHLLLEQVAEGGIVKFMKSLGNGYTKYFNNKLKRKGPIFEGIFNSKYVDNNDYLLHLSAYINLNYQVHGLLLSQTNQPEQDKSKSVGSRSSWKEYSQEFSGMCVKESIMENFKHKEEYIKYAEKDVKDTLELRSGDDGDDGCE